MVNVIWAAICAGLILSNWLLWREVMEVRGLLIIHFDFHFDQDPEWGKKVEKFIQEQEEKGEY